MPPLTTKQNFNLIGTEGFEGGPLWGGPRTSRPPTGGGLQYNPAAAAPPQTLSALGGAGTIDPRFYGADLGAGLGGGLGNLAVLLGGAGEGARPALEDALQVYMALQDPDFDLSDLTPAQYRIAATMQPELFEAQLPGDPSLIADSPLARAQMAESVLGLGEISRTGLPEADRLAAEQAARAVRGAIRGGEESGIRSLRRRGRLGAGQELLARGAGGREASDLAARLGSDLQRQALDRRLQALSQYGSAAGALRGQDVGVEQSRADAMNRFKEFAALQRQQAAQYGAGARERAQTYNVGTAQDVANQQAEANRQAALENVERQNQMRQQTFQNQLARAGGIAGTQAGLAGVGAAEQKAKAEQLQLIGRSIGGGLGGLGGLFGGGGI